MDYGTFEPDLQTTPPTTLKMDTSQLRKSIEYLNITYDTCFILFSLTSYILDILVTIHFYIDINDNSIRNSYFYSAIACMSIYYLHNLWIHVFEHAGNIAIIIKILTIPLIFIIQYISAYKFYSAQALTDFTRSLYPSQTELLSDFNEYKDTLPINPPTKQWKNMKKTTFSRLIIHTILFIIPQFLLQLVYILHFQHQES